MGGTIDTYHQCERLVFQSLTYRTERPNCNEHMIPVMFVLTSNVPDSAYQPEGIYYPMVQKYQHLLENYVGPTEVFCVGDTKQVNNYPYYNWTRFDGEGKTKRHEQVFPSRLAEAKAAGARMAEGSWSR